MNSIQSGMLQPAAEVNGVSNLSPSQAPEHQPPPPCVRGAFM